MNDFTAKIDSHGRLVIPAACRKALNLKAGDPVLIRLEDKGMSILTLDERLKQAQALATRYCKSKSLVQDLKKQRDKDFKDEQRNL